MTDQKKPILGNKSYDVTKDLVTIYIPALATFYAAMSAIWGLPFGEEIVGSLTAVAALLGATVKVSSKQYANQPVEYDGAMIQNLEDPEAEAYRLELDVPLTSIADRSELRFQVRDEGSQ